MSSPSSLTISLLDYGAGNVRSVRNAILACGYHDVNVDVITEPQQIKDAQILIFPGVGSYASAMDVLKMRGYITPLQAYLKNADRPYLGICLGMQTLFESSQEDYDVTGVDQEVTSSSSIVPGLDILPGPVIKFDHTQMTVPHIGWNGRTVHQDSPVLSKLNPKDETYFVHSFYAPITSKNEPYILTSTTYSNQRFISAIQKNQIVATQFHPEKSGEAGLAVLKGFLEAVQNGTLGDAKPITPQLPDPLPPTQLVKRIVVALDVRTNDHGDLVVTKGDQYDVRENSSGVRNLGKPVSLAGRYYQDGADEICFLNITSFRNGVMDDAPMLQVLEAASETIFVPLTVGGGIQEYSAMGQTWSALEVAARYFRAGADKVSIGSDAVRAVEALQANGGNKTGTSSIETISRVYGAQAVVVSIDPKRVYVTSTEEAREQGHVVVDLNDDDQLGPNGEIFCWYQCTIKGGRESRNVCAITLAKSVEYLGAGEIMLNCIDMDGQCNGYDLALLRAVTDAVTIPVIASSGAGTANHFVEAFTNIPKLPAALAAGMFHRQEVEIEAVKKALRDAEIPARSRESKKM